MEVAQNNVGEYTLALSEISGLKSNTIQKIINQSEKEVLAAENIVFAINH